MDSSQPAQADVSAALNLLNAGNKAVSGITVMPWPAVVLNSTATCLSGGRLPLPAAAGLSC